jgi:hypothetical protein
VSKVKLTAERETWSGSKQLQTSKKSSLKFGDTEHSKSTRGTDKLYSLHCLSASKLIDLASFLLVEEDYIFRGGGEGAEGESHSALRVLLPLLQYRRAEEEATLLLCVS